MRLSVVELLMGTSVDYAVVTPKDYDVGCNYDVDYDRDFDYHYDYASERAFDCDSDYDYYFGVGHEYDLVLNPNMISFWSGCNSMLIFLTHISIQGCICIMNEVIHLTNAAGP